MTFKKNVERERALLEHWRMGYKVKVASLLSGIPEGSVSHYYARFNRNKDKYHRVSEGGVQEPPKSTPFEIALTGLFITQVFNKLRGLIYAENYKKVCEYLQSILLICDFVKRFQPILQNADPSQEDEVLKNMIAIMKLL